MEWGLFLFFTYFECIKKECFSALCIVDNLLAKALNLNAEALDVRSKADVRKVGINLSERIKDSFINVDVVIHSQQDAFGSVDNLFSEESVDSSHCCYLLYLFVVFLELSILYTILGPKSILFLSFLEIFLLVMFVELVKVLTNYVCIIPVIYRYLAHYLSYLIVL